MQDFRENERVARLRPRAELELEDLIRQNMINKVQSKTISTEHALAQSKVDQLQEAAFLVAEERHLVLREDQLMLAIERMDSATFGSCMDCAGAIEADRLERDICTQLCSKCAGLRIY